MNNSDEVYLQMLKEENSKIGKKMEDANNMNKGILKVTGIPSKKIEEYVDRRQNLNTIINSYNGMGNINKLSGHFVEKLDEKVQENNDQINDTQAQIASLQTLRDSLTTCKEKRKVNKKIEQQQKIICKLKESNVKISKKQRFLIMPKKVRHMYRMKLLSKAETRVRVVEDSINYNNYVRSMLNPDDNLKDAALDFIYDLRGMLYESRLNHAQDVLDTVQQAKWTIAMKGATAIVLRKNVVDKLKNRIKTKKKTNTK